jgi:formylglycine-generating enzyme required for sulfatase activity
MAWTLFLACLFAAVFTGNALASEAGMVRIPGGTFIMGSDRGLPDERPAHPVTLKSFWIDRRPVTNAEFADFLNKVGGTSNARGQHLFDWDDGDARIHHRQGRWRADPGFEEHPANEMSWYGARDYCGSLGRRLPTEAEREFAARGRGAHLPVGRRAARPHARPLWRGLDRDRSGRLLSRRCDAGRRA